MTKLSEFLMGCVDVALKLWDIVEEEFHARRADRDDPAPDEPDENSDSLFDYDLTEHDFFTTSCEQSNGE